MAIHSAGVCVSTVVSSNASSGSCGIGGMTTSAKVLAHAISKWGSNSQTSNR
jgi:hypothetical protein